jgi:spore photoproduct lyase
MLRALTKSADVNNLLDLDHRGNSILSWTLNPEAIVEAFEPNTPTLETRIRAMEACVEAGYPVRAVVMPIIPVPEWEIIYCEFLSHLLGRVRLARLTLGSICSYPEAMRLTEQKLGPDHSISSQVDRRRNGKLDGRTRFPRELREKIYRHLLDLIQRLAPSLEVGLCLEEEWMFDRIASVGER